MRHFILQASMVNSRERHENLTTLHDIWESFEILQEHFPSLSEELVQDPSKKSLSHKEANNKLVLALAIDINEYAKSQNSDLLDFTRPNGHLGNNSLQESLNDRLISFEELSPLVKEHIEWFISNGYLKESRQITLHDDNIDLLKKILYHVNQNFTEPEMRYPHLGCTQADINYLLNTVNP